MRSRFRVTLVALLAPLLLLGPSTGVFAASPARLSAHVAMNRLAIAIMSTGGTVWGKVSLHYSANGHKLSRTCSKSKCSVKVVHGTKVRVSETATDSATWPFSKWQMKWSGGTKTMKGSSITFKVNGKTTLTAIYVLASSQSGGNGW